MRHNGMQEAAPPGPLAPDAPFIFVVNAGSGSRDTEQTVAALREALRECGRPHEMVLGQGGGIVEAAQRGVHVARQRRGAVIAVGGDGTANAVAQATLGSGLPFAVVPQGTFNYFGREHGLPDDPAEAARLLHRAPVRPVPVGMANDHIFLINASLGLYPKMLEERESFTRQLGRRRGVALLASFKALLQERGQLLIDIEEDGQHRSLITPTLFIGNNSLQLSRLGVREADQIRHGHLTAIAVAPVGTFSMIGLALRGALGTLGDSDKVSSFAFSQLRVSPRRYGRKRIKVALDGEIVRMETPLVFRAAPQLLYALVPEPAMAVTAA